MRSPDAPQKTCLYVPVTNYHCTKGFSRYRNLQYLHQILTFYRRQSLDVMQAYYIREEGECKMQSECVSVGMNAQ